MRNENTAVVERWFHEVWVEKRAATIHELLTSESVLFGDDETLIGPDEFRQRQFEPIVKAFPDLALVLEATLTEGDQVAALWHATGTHTREGLGVPPTGKALRVEGISWITVRDGKLVEGRQYTTLRQAFRSLGAFS